MADLILHNCRLWTQDSHFAAATAVAVQSGRFLAVGGDAEVLALAGPATRVIDLDGRRVLPGLVDAHCHFKGWALARRNLQLAGAPSLDAVLEDLRRAAQAAPAGRWIVGQGWNESDWAEPRLLTRHDLDAAAPEHPVLLKRSDLHLATANSPALRLAGITAATPDPEAGLIDRDRNGQPTGILRDKAIDLVGAVMPGPADDDVDAAVLDAQAEAHRLGLTGVHDFRIGAAEESRSAFEAWQRLWARGELALRVWMMIGGDALDDAIRLGLRTGFGDDRLRIGGIKLFADGSLGARTAWMLEPYADGGAGLPIVPMAEIAGKVERAQAAGISAGIHAIGDRAIRELLDVFAEVLPRTAEARSAPARMPAKTSQSRVSGAEARSGAGGNTAEARSAAGVQAKTGRSRVTSPSGSWNIHHSSLTIHHSPSSFLLPPSKVPHRIEHVQHSHPEDLQRLGELGLVASVQPIHLVDDMALVERTLGERSRWAYAFRTLLDSGAVLALGSDCPVASPNPFWGIHAAVTRQRRDGYPAGGWHPEQRLSVAEAVAGYTLGPALASSQLDRLGSITPGKLADLVVLDRDIFAVPPGEIAETQVVMTLFDGEIVYSNGDL